MLKNGIAHGEGFVDDQDLRHHADRGREGEPYVHAAAVSFDRRINKLLNFSERDDLVKLRFDFAPRHAEDRTVEIDVLATS